MVVFTVAKDGKIRQQIVTSFPANDGEISGQRRAMIDDHTDVLRLMTSAFIFT